MNVPHATAQPDPLNPLVEVRSLQKSYGGNVVLKSVNLSVGHREILGLVGENGAGKSTLGKILAGEVKRDGGEIVWKGTPVRLDSRADSERLGIAMIHQELNLALHLTVAENIFLGHEPRGRFGVPGTIDRQREFAEAQESLERMQFDLDSRVPVRRLSPAQRQLVEIARAVARQQRLVIMDEPTSSLSAREVDELFRVIRQVRDHGAAVIFVTHRLEELAQVADRVAVLRDGEKVHDGAMPSADFGPLIRAMVGRELKDFFPARHAERRAAGLTVEGLCREPDFEGISFTVRGGEIVGLAGLIGAGRTELVETIFGVKPADRGKIEIDGREVRIRSPHDAIRNGMALITEDRKRTGLALKLSVAQNITLAKLREIQVAGRLNLEKESAVARGFVERLRIRARSTAEKLGRLSGGNQQKVVMAKWLFTKSRVFIFDEPTRGVDVGAKNEIYRLMNELAESGAAILMVSSELPEILGMTDRVLVMRQGRIVKELVTAETTQEEIMRHAALGGA